nr:immunoglobulin light chain junction region [Macaca mulatta]
DYYCNSYGGINTFIF